MSDTDDTGIGRPRQSDEGAHKTGIVWSYRLEGQQMFSGDYETRHEAIGMATILGRITGKDWEVRWHESMWEKHENPVVCDYCGWESYYSPLSGWTHPLDVDAGPFCTSDCWEAWKENNAEKVPNATE